MNCRQEISQHSEKIWVLGLTDEALSQPLSPLLESIDWYLNFIITKYLKAKKPSLTFGELLLVYSNQLVIAEKVLVVGLGARDLLNPTLAKKFSTLVANNLSDLKVEKPWLVFSSSVPADFTGEVEKTFSVSLG